MTFFYIRLFLFSAALIFSANSVFAYSQQENLCEPYPLVDVNVTPIFENPLLDTTQELTAIQAMAHSSKDIIPQYNHVTLGLTHYEPVMEIRAPMVSRQLPDGTFCSRIERVDVAIGYRNVRIFVANELTADNCSLNHVIEHEQKHIAVNQMLLQEFVPLIKERLIAYFRLYGQFISPNPEYSASLLREKANNILMDMSKGMFEENKRRQRLVDTPEEYARNNTVCGGWINRLMIKYRLSKR